MGTIDSSTSRSKQENWLQFFSQELPEKMFSQKIYHAALLKVFHRLVQKYQHLQAYWKERTQKYSLCPLKKN